jgi:hypothetical protein
MERPTGSWKMDVYLYSGAALLGFAGYSPRVLLHEPYVLKHLSTFQAARVVTFVLGLALMAYSLSRSLKIWTGPRAS